MIKKMKPGTLFVISASSGAGKTTLVSALMGNIADCPVQRIITYTTRPPRTTDREGHDYHFITVPEFQKKVQEGFFIEWSQVYGHYYGSPASIINKLEQQISLVIILDIKGAQALKAQLTHAILIWIDVDQKQLSQRLIARATDTPDQIAIRIDTAAQELMLKNSLNIYNYHMVNENFDQSLAILTNIVRTVLSAHALSDVIDQE